MKLSRLYKDGSGREFTATIEVADEHSDTFERLILQLANKARGNSRKRATAADGFIVVEIKEAGR